MKSMYLERRAWANSVDQAQPPRSATSDLVIHCLRLISHISDTSTGSKIDLSLWNHDYSNILKILQPKKGKFSDKNSDIFQISAQNIDCGYSLEPPRRGGSNEYPQSMFLSRNKKNNVYPCKPQFYYIKVGLKGVKII